MQLSLPINSDYHQGPVPGYKHHHHHSSSLHKEKSALSTLQNPMILSNYQSTNKNSTISHQDLNNSGAKHPANETATQGSQNIGQGFAHCTTASIRSTCQQDENADTVENRLRLLGEMPSSSSGGTHGRQRVCYLEEPGVPTGCQGACNCDAGACHGQHASGSQSAGYNQSVRDGGHGSGSLG